MVRFLFMNFVIGVMIRGMSIFATTIKTIRFGKQRVDEYNKKITEDIRSRYKFMPQWAVDIQESLLYISDNKTIWDEISLLIIASIPGLNIACAYLTSKKLLKALFSKEF